MKKYYVAVGILFLSLSSYSQHFKNDSIKLFIDSSISLIRQHSLHTENLDAIQRDLYKRAENLAYLDEVPPLYEEVFKQLNDYHGNLKYKGKTYGWSVETTAANDYLKEKLKLEKKVVSKIINDEFAYISIPGNNDFAFRKVDSLANDIVEHINTVNSPAVKGWIIDLRLNTGGNMYPILLGLKEFIGDNIVFGGFKNAQGESTGSWEVKNGNLLIDGTALERKSQLVHSIEKEIPVVILTSCYTASAGEMVTISFIGRDNTYIVGETTANYTTAVQGYRINQVAGINLSTDYVVDRKSNVYKGNIIPGVIVLGGDNLEELKKDSKIIKALAFLKK
ncbi:S41 family peptidase [Gynurincola endophyticus]|uniref:S41 family peptidase n=1 Tax=Gynurincola endophyticus TaxID=2479004 RepID=UPI000F8CED43|nr:S41 family peptidase [Gynurincola endophyticus]